MKSYLKKRKPLVKEMQSKLVKDFGIYEKLKNSDGGKLTMEATWINALLDSL